MRILFFDQGNQCLMAVYPVKPAVAESVVIVIMGVDNNDLLARCQSLHQCFGVAQAKAGIYQQAFLRADGQPLPYVSRAITVWHKQAIQIVTELVNLHIWVTVIHPAGIVMLPQTLHIGIAHQVLRAEPGKSFGLG